VYDGAVTPADLEMWESELEGLFARLRPLFYRTESKKHAQQYVRGLLSPMARKNGWTIAEHVGEPEPTPLQRFLNLDCTRSCRHPRWLPLITQRRRSRGDTPTLYPGVQGPGR